MRTIQIVLCGCLLCIGCTEPKDIEGADGRSWRRSETRTIDGCTITLTNGWLAESDGWTGALYFDARNDGDASTPCMTVGALVGASTEPVSVTSKTSLISPGEERSWKLEFKSPAITDIYSDGAWLYVGVRGRDPRAETGFHVYELPTTFEHDYE